MRFALTGGGTAGHVYPALALASELASQGHEIEFAGAPGSLEERLATQHGYAFTAFRASGFDRARPLTLLTAVYQVVVSSVRTWGWLRQRGIDGVIGFGGYVSIPLGLGSVLSGVPLVIHEQNSVPGLANRFLSRWARSLCITYPESAGYFSGSSGTRIVHTGNPVRSELLKASRATGRSRIGIPDDATVVLVFGGSRGARHLNEVMVSMGAELLAQQDTYVVHATGPAEYEAVSGKAKAQELSPDRYRVVPYIEDMGDVMAATDLAICRAGATSIAELTALGVGAVLVPYPYATDDHQTKNATAMVQHGAAVSFADAAIAGTEFREAVLSIVTSPERRASMAVAAARLGRRDAAQRLAAAVLDSVR